MIRALAILLATVATAAPEVGQTYLVEVTGYCPCRQCCGRWAKWGRTASGRRPVEGRTVAANWLPLGTVVRIQGFRITKVVEDRMSRKFPARLDLYFRRHADAAKWGNQKRRVTVVSLPERNSD